MSLWWRWLETHVATVGTAVLIVAFLARILRERRPQGSTLAWMLAVVAIPYVAIPLYLAIGQRKLVRRAKQLYANNEESARAIEPDVARLLCASGTRVPKDGNTIELIAAGEAAFEALIALIDGATRSIHVSTFILGGDATGDAILARLTARAAAGVEVRLMLDGLFAFRPRRRRLAALRAAGGKIATFSPIIHLPFRSYNNLRNHRKLALFDGEVAIVGGMNLAEEYMGPTQNPERWSDLCARVRGPAVGDVADVFALDWEFATGEALTRAARATERGTSRAQVVPSGPDSAADAFYEAILSACYGAERRVWIATPYFVPDDALTRALCAASRRGVEVRVVVPLRSNHRLADFAGGPALRQVESAGGRIATHPRMLHAKAVVIDDAIGVVGSSNFDMRSLFLDYELSLFLYAARDVAALAAWFEATERGCASLPRAGVVRSIAEDIGRLLAPLV